MYVDTRDNDIFRNFSPRTASYDLFPFSSPKSNFFVSSSSPRYHPSPLSVVYIYIMPSGMYSSVGDGGWKPSMSVCLACVSLDRACDGLGGKDILSLSLSAALLQNGPHTLETHSYSFHSIQATMAFVKTKDTLFLCPSCGTISILHSPTHKNTHIH